MAASSSAAPAAAVTPVYIAAAASRNNASAARLEDGLVAFASGRLVALWNSADPASNGVRKTLAGHQADVSALKFVHQEGESSCFVSGDAAGVARVWSESEGEWTTVATLSGHAGSISSVEALRLPSDGGEGRLLVLTGGSDAVIQVWVVTASGAAESAQKIDCKGKIPLELALSYLPASSSLVLAVGGTETRIQLYTGAPSDKPSFRKSLSLEGHTDWIRCLSFTTPIQIPAEQPASSPSTSSSTTYDISPGEVLLASGSQDNYIRLWRFSRLSHQDPPAPSLSPSPAAKSTGLDALDELEKTLNDAAPEEGELRVKAHDFTVLGDGRFSCSSEAVLLGHDAWVTGLNWAPHLPAPASSASSAPSSLRLLSSSADRSMILWAPVTTLDPSTSASSTTWTSTRRFGEFTSATNLGFFGALWGKGTRSVLASGWGGSWHVWQQQDEREGGEGEWEPQVAVSGHLGAVKQVKWEREGEYLLSASNDMSTRLHAPWRRTLDGKAIETWHELGRPQIHGYPLTSLAFTDRLQFVSGADEKVVRVFDAPKVFVSGLRRLSGVVAGDEESRPMAANVPPLGLSNRAIATAADAEQLAPASNDPFETILPVNFSVSEYPPLEEQLLGSTLWPETEKLYGHAFELVSVASAHTHPLIATACKATLPEHALVRLYDTTNWQPVRGEGGVLDGHALTITRLAFSRGDRWLLSVSRDRTWRVYERDDGEGLGYRPIASSKSHARIIWDACWAADDSFFVTASRDKTAKIWTQHESTWICAATLKFDEAATSVAVTSVASKQLHLVAVGLENGQIHLFTAPGSDVSTWTPLLVLDSSIAHVLAVSTLSFCPKKDLGERTVRLASGSEDRSVRIFDVSLT
ncbi:hypothetical protein JCM21900_000482 [Sporobolomyces salmonicolor]